MINGAEAWLPILSIARRLYEPGVSPVPITSELEPAPLPSVCMSLVSGPFCTVIVIDVLGQKPEKEKLRL
jgi:hypothetical protein